jgi:hypothetical protein
VVLWRTGGSRSQTTVGRSIDSATQDSILEKNVVRNNRSGKMVRDRFHDFEDSFFFVATIFTNDLKRAKQLGRKQLKFFYTSEMLKRDVHGCWLPAAVDSRNGMVFERVASVQNLSSIKF